METNEYRKKLAALFTTWGEVTPGERPSPEKIEGYINICLNSKLAFEQIEQNGSDAIRRHGFFPKVNELFNPIDEDVQAIEDLEFIKDLVDNFVFDGFGGCASTIIEMKLKEAGKEHLWDFANRWGMELAYSDNPTATRAQALKILKVENQRENERLLCSGENVKLIEEVINSIAKADE